MRGVRLLLEYEKAEERLRAWVVRSTIVVFGSARIRPTDANAQTLESDKTLARWYEEARRFGGDFCLATHYWEIDATLARVIRTFLDFAARQPKVRFVAVDELFA